MAVADTSIQNLQRMQLQLNEEKANRSQQLAQLQAESAEKEEALEMKRVDLVQLQEQHEKTKEQIFETQQQLEVLRSELADENRKLDAKRNEYNLLKSLIDSMEGYPESISERYGFVPFRLKQSIWIHSVSMGESIAIAPLVKKLASTRPQDHFIVTTMTPTGSAQVQKLYATFSNIHPLS